MAETTRADEVLRSFGEVMAKLLIDQYQRHITELDLTLPQAQVLRVLRRDGAVATGRLAAELGISAPAVTQLTDRLVRKGLIERHAAADDRRTVLLRLSSKGSRQVEQFRRRRHEAFHGALAELDERERGRVVESLAVLVEALRSYEEKLAAGRGAERSSLKH